MPFLRTISLIFALLLSWSACAQIPLTGAGKGAPGSWTPAQLPGLIAWYKADNDGTNVFTDTGCSTPATNSTTVACWKDLSGNGYNCLQATSGNRPTYLTAGLNSKPTLSFSSVAFTGCITTTGVAFGTGTSASAFIIGTLVTSAANSNFANATAYCGPVSVACNLTGDFLGTFRNTSGAQSVSSVKGTVATGASAITYSTETRMGGVADGSNITTYINNVAGTPTAVTNASLNAGCIVIGNTANACAFLSASGQNAWNGVMSEIVITNNAMSSGDRALLDAYLSGRW